MQTKLSLLLCSVVAMIFSAPVAAQIEAEEGVMISASEVPEYVPEILRQEWYQRPEIPEGWNSATPHGGVVADEAPGKLEIAALELNCDFLGEGNRQTVVSGLDGIGAGLYLKQPWFGGSDYNERPTMKRKSYRNQEGKVYQTIVFDVPTDRVLHFWSSRAKLPSGTDHCSTKAVVRAEGNILGAVGADWWKSPTAMWAGLNKNNQEIGVSDWYDLSNGEWQIMRLNY